MTGLAIKGFIWCIISIINFIVLIISSKNTSRNSPLNDNEWNFTHEILEHQLRRFITNTQEIIVSVLGKNNIQKIIDTSTNKNGFCILTNKAFYFVGKVFHTKYFLPFKSNVQHRINASEIKGVKVIKQYNAYAIIALLISIFLTCRLIQGFFIVIPLLDSGYYTTIGFKILGIDFEDYGLIAMCIALLFVLVSLFMSIIQLCFYRLLVVVLEFDKYSYRFPVNILGEQEIKDFYKAVSQIQENVSSDINSNMQANVTQTSNSKNKVESLSEISQLLEKGIINQEEFDKLKSDILNGN